MHCKAIGRIKNFEMHTLKQVYIHVVCVELYCLTQVQSLFDFEFFVKTPIFQHLNPTLKIHFKIYAYFGVESKSKSVELDKLSKVCFWIFSSCVVKFGVIQKGVIR